MEKNTSAPVAQLQKHHRRYPEDGSSESMFFSIFSLSYNFNMITRMRYTAAMSDKVTANRTLLAAASQPKTHAEYWY